MNWIIWTCGWALTVDVCEYLASKHRDKKEAENGFYAFVMLAIWVVGMIKFW